MRGKAEPEDICQVRIGLLNRWTNVAGAFSDAIVNRVGVEEIESSRRETQKAHKAFKDHVSEHGWESPQADRLFDRLMRP